MLTSSTAYSAQTCSQRRCCGSCGCPQTLHTLPSMRAQESGGARFGIQILECCDGVICWPSTCLFHTVAELSILVQTTALTPCRCFATAHTKSFAWEFT